MRKKKVLFLFLETVAVSFKWWVYEICRHGNCKVGVLGPFFSALGVEFLFRKQMYRNLYLGIKRGLLHRVEKVCRKKKCLILLLLCRKQIPFLTCAYFSPPSGMDISVGSYDVGARCIFTGACNFLTVSLSF